MENVKFLKSLFCVQEKKNLFTLELVSFCVEKEARRRRRRIYMKTSPRLFKPLFVCQIQGINLKDIKIYTFLNERIKHALLYDHGHTREFKYEYLTCYLTMVIYGSECVTD
jgi:hypothetical protein